MPSTYGVHYNHTTCNEKTWTIQDLDWRSPFTLNLTWGFSHMNLQNFLKCTTSTKSFLDQDSATCLTQYGRCNFNQLIWLLGLILVVLGLQLVGNTGHYRPRWIKCKTDLDVVSELCKLVMMVRDQMRLHSKRQSKQRASMKKTQSMPWTRALVVREILPALNFQPSATD